MKSYSSKSTAIRAARRELRKANPNLSNDAIEALYTLEPHETNVGEFYWRRVQLDLDNETVVNEIVNEVIRHFIDNAENDTQRDMYQGLLSGDVNVPKMIVAQGRDAIDDYITALVNSECPTVDETTRIKKCIDEALGEFVADANDLTECERRNDVTFDINAIPAHVLGSSDDDIRTYVLGRVKFDYEHDADSTPPIPLMGNIDAADIADISNDILSASDETLDDVFMTMPEKRNVDAQNVIYNKTPEVDVASDVEQFIANGGAIEKVDESAIVDESEDDCKKALDAVGQRMKRQIENASTASLNVAVIADNTTSDGMLRKSAIASPCAIVWAIAEKMHAQNARRKDIVNECVRRGVATHTARTQYQKWFTAYKNSANSIANNIANNNA